MDLKYLAQKYMIWDTHTRGVSMETQSKNMSGQHTDSSLNPLITFLLREKAGAPRENRSNATSSAASQARAQINK